MTRESLRETARHVPLYRTRCSASLGQSKISVELAAAVQSMGADAEYVILDASGRNALDFHIAYYIGALSAHEPSAFFHVISKDTGFDPLLRHLKIKGVLAQRSVAVSCIPLLKPALPTTVDARVDAAVAHLIKLKAAKPRAQKTLMSTLHALFKKELSDHQVSALFSSLCERGLVKVEGDKVAYQLPSA